MAVKNFILQGFTPRTHIGAIENIFNIPDIQQVIFSVAFVTEDGVRLIENKLRSFADKTKIFAGVRNDITSLQGLSRLLDLGTSVYVVDTGARNILFHPKLYLVRGKTQAGLIIGSANLTLGGLNNNIEAGLSLELDLTNSEDRKLVEDIENQFLVLPTRDPEHILLITTIAKLNELQASGRLLDEAEASPPRPTITTAEKSSDDTISRIKLSVPPLHRTIKRAKAEPAVKRISQPVPGQVESVKSEVATNLEIVWESKPLTERDLNIPEARGTHATGSINLDKGLLDEGIDHRHYFRDAVFAQLQWTPRSSGSVEEASARFQLVIKDILHGEFTLQVRHSTDITSTTYQQHNAMTRLSWGSMREFVAKRDLIDRTLSLYRDETDPSRFVLEID